MKPLEEQSFYELLDVPADVTQPALDRAFEQAMQFYGPDSVAVYSLVDPEETAKLVQRLEEAYLTLSDPELRRDYDTRLGTIAASLAAAAAPVPQPTPESAPAPAASAPATAAAEPEAEAEGELALEPAAAAEPAPERPAREVADQLELRPILKAARIYPWPAAARSSGETTRPEPPAEAPASAKLAALLGAIPPAEPAEAPLALVPDAGEGAGAVSAARAVPTGEERRPEPSPALVPFEPTTEPPTATASAAAREVPIVVPASPRPAAAVSAVRPVAPPHAVKAERPSEGPVGTRAVPAPAVRHEASAAAPVEAPAEPAPAKTPAPEPEPTPAAPPEEPRAAPPPPASVSPKPAARPVEIPADAVFNGELLRRVRESKGMSLPEVADKTRIGRMHLENIEADRYDLLPATVYLRGFLMTYARELKLDPLKVSKSYLELVTGARAGGAKPGPKG